MMECFRPIIAVIVACVCFAVDAQNNAYFTIYSISFRYNANQDGVFLIEAASNSTSSPRSNIITGVNLWRSELYASQTQDGSGLKAVLSQQLLNQEQTSRILRPGETLKFSTPLSINLNTLSSSFPYLCMKLSKHPSARPRYQFIAGRNNFLLGCSQVRAETQSLQTNNPSRNSVDFNYYHVMYRYEIQPATTRNPQSVHVISVQITTRAAPTSITFSGANTWQATLFVGEGEDGYGGRIILSNQLLNLNQASTSVYPGQILTFTANQRFNLDRYGPGTSFPYLCTEFTKTPSANVEIRFGNSRSAVYCGTITTGATDLTESQAEVNTYNADIVFTQTDPNSNTAVANIVYIVYFSDSSSTITGGALWQLRLYASENADGTGARRLLSQQLLNRNQISTGVEPGGQLRFEINPVFQLQGLGPGTNLPYLCVAFNKHPQAAMQVNYQGSEVITSCEPIPRLAEQTPRAVVRQSDARISFTRNDPSSTNVITNVNYDLLFDTTSDVIDGNPLWQLGMFASQNSDGTGPALMISRQLLDENQVSTSVRPGGVIRFTKSESFDFTGLGPGTPLPYICMSLEKHPSADFELVFGDRNVIIGCRALPISMIQQTDRAVVRQRDAQISFTRFDPSSTNVITNVNYDLLFDTTSDVIDGNPLWQLGMFASQNSDGTGPARMISRQLLDENQVSTSVRPGGVIRFTTSESFDFTGLGPGTLLPFICLSLEKHPSADFELVFGDRNVIIGCRALPLSMEQQAPRAVVRQSDAQISFIGNDQSSTNVITNVNYDLIFDTSSDVVNGNPLWQLMLFASQNIDGTGPARVISRQLLDENQAASGVRPGSVLRFTTSERFDLTGLGPGTILPYICASLEKHPRADFALVLGDRNVITRCRELPQFAEQTPRAVVRRNDSEISFTRTDPFSPNVDSVVNYNVAFASSSDIIYGDELWQLRMFASQNSDGSGRRRTISVQLLDENQVSDGVRPGGQLRFVTRQSVDIRGLGTGTRLPYICLLLQKHPNANFEIVFGDSNVVMGCRELSPFEVSPIDLTLPVRAIVDDQNTQMTFTSTDPSNNTAVVNVILDVEFDDTSDTIDGDTLWQLRLLASQYADGSGARQLISEQLLSREEMSIGIRPGGRLLIEETESFDTTNLGPDTQLPYICVVLNQHPTADFQLVNRDSNLVMTCEPLPLFQAPEAEETKTCRLWGDPHQKTFDGYGYTFQGEAEYIAVKTCKDIDGTLPEFQIIAENFRRRPSKPITYIRVLKLEYNDVVYELIHPERVLVDGVAVTLPFSDETGVKIHISPPHKILTTNFGLVMRLDNFHNSDITLPVRFANKVCGTCGNFDGIRGNECHYRDATSMEQRNEECKHNFTEEWRYNTTDPPPPYGYHIKPLTPCGEGSALLATADDKCSILTDPSGPLAPCHPFVMPDFYYETCVFDLCQLLPSAFLLCGHVEAYILECSQVTGGTVEVEYWRDVTEECELYCEEGMTFVYRGNPCPPTCAKPDGAEEDCPFPFLETCQCNEGTVLDGTRCVNVTDCGCQMEGGRYLSIGEEFMSLDCSESCLCTEDRELQCTPVTCAASSECDIKSGKRDCYCQPGYTGYGREECVEAVKMCRIYGDPHFSTFDQDFYSFQGNCAYTAVRTCQTLPRGVFPFQIHIKNDALVPEDRYTYITLVRLHFRGIIYRMRYTGEVTVNGVNIVNSLPFRDTNTGVHISKYNNSVLLHTDAGLHINLTSDTELTIKLPPVYFGKVCGLCGNADGNSTNDKQLPDGTLGKKLSFANSWRLGSCTPMDEPVESCVVGSDEEARAIDICSDIVRKDGPFANCYDFRDPTHFYESCVFDLCATLPSTELFCVSANQYLQACIENGGSVKGDWKKDVEYCSSVNCPEGYTAFKDSCYRYYRTKKTFEQSKTFCSRRGGHLVTITSRAENNFVSDLAEETSSWIGAERNHSASFKTYTSYGNESYTFLPKRIPSGVGSIRFGVVAQSNAYIILSPTRNPDENTPLYEFAIGSNRNKKSFIRRCMSCPEEDSEKKALLKKGQEKRFFINFHDGRIRMGRYSKRDISLRYGDEDPIVVKYIAFKTVGSESTWNFYDNEFMWITNESWSYDKYRFGEPSNYNNEEHCLETNYDSNHGIWNDHFCSQRKSFVCEVGGE